MVSAGVLLIFCTSNPLKATTETYEKNLYEKFVSYRDGPVKSMETIYSVGRDECMLSIWPSAHKL